MGLVYLHVANKAALPLNHDLSKALDPQPRLVDSLDQYKSTSSPKKQLHEMYISGLHLL